ncbi:MAG: hypothetical protein QF815_01605 [Candidatus Peribacteraceae bacterium]|jgi:hypothetical protein|nr:hypothetical protein [Candidatus Peribacteraceae bacterium]
MKKTIGFSIAGAFFLFLEVASLFLLKGETIGLWFGISGLCFGLAVWGNLDWSRIPLGLISGACTAYFIAGFVVISWLDSRADLFLMLATFLTMLITGFELIEWLDRRKRPDRGGGGGGWRPQIPPPPYPPASSPVPTEDSPAPVLSEAIDEP